MIRKLGTYHEGCNGRYIVAKFKNGIKLNFGDIVTDDMIEDYKEPLWNSIVNLLCNNYSNPFGGPSKNHGQMADAILDLLKK